MSREMTTSVRSDLHEQLGADFININVEHIYVGERSREPTPEAVAALADDIKQHCLLQPIGIKRGAPDGTPYRHTLIWGATRLAAFKSLRLPGDPLSDPVIMDSRCRFDLIPSIVFPRELPDDMARMLELAENTVRFETDGPPEVRWGKLLEARLRAGVGEVVQAKIFQNAKICHELNSSTCQNLPTGNPQGRGKISWLTQLVKLAKESKDSDASEQTLRRRFEDFASETGFDGTPAQAPPDVQLRFATWLQGAKERETASQLKAAAKAAADKAKAEAEKAEREERELSERFQNEFTALLDKFKAKRDVAWVLRKAKESMEAWAS